MFWFPKTEATTHLCNIHQRFRFVHVWRYAYRAVVCQAVLPCVFFHASAVILEFITFCQENP